MGQTMFSSPTNIIKGKGKGRILIQRSLRDYRTSALYNRGSGTVAVDWQEQMVLQRKLRPSNCTR